eukprot:jgi/Botrbrau1/9384/Bobra.0252s0009.2
MAAPPPVFPRARGRALLVCDFDWSLAEENSDTWALEALGMGEAFRGPDLASLPWTQRMDAALSLAGARGVSRPALHAALCSIPFCPAIRKALQKADRLEHVEKVIVSDANSEFIRIILAEQGLGAAFRAVHTNPGVWEGHVLRVKPYHGLPPGCPRCPPNLCKGRVLEGLLMERNYHQVAYLGDGGGDFCPTRLLGSHDTVMARQRYPDGRPCALYRLLKRHAGHAGISEGPHSPDAGAADGVSSITNISDTGAMSGSPCTAFGAATSRVGNSGTESGTGSGDDSVSRSGRGRLDGECGSALQSRGATERDRVAAKVLAWTLPEQAAELLCRFVEPNC